MQKSIFRPVGQCIYCGRSDCRLTDEHIVPLALNGMSVLPEASCDGCANLTKKFENSVARSMYGKYRIKKDFRTRRKKERPTKLPLMIADRAGALHSLNIPVDQYPHIYMRVHAAVPGILAGRQPNDLNSELKLELAGSVDGIPDEARKLLSKRFVTEHTFEWAPFFRQIAKIAHCFAYAYTGGKGFVPFLPDLILGRSAHLAHYVGGFGDAPPEVLKTMENCLFSLRANGENYLMAGVQILGIGVLPPYQVVVGRLVDESAFVSLEV